MNEYPLFPELSEEGKAEVQLLIDSFKDKLTKVAEETIANLYTDAVSYIESDSWTNFRNQIMDGFKDYDNRKIQGEWNFKEIRAEIFKQFKSDIITDLNQDIYEENLKLKQQIIALQQLREWERSRR
jgi:type III secretory pathway component EscR